MHWTSIFYLHASWFANKSLQFLTNWCCVRCFYGKKWLEGFITNTKSVQNPFHYEISVADTIAINTYPCNQMFASNVNDSDALIWTSLKCSKKLTMFNSWMMPFKVFWTSFFTKKKFTVRSQLDTLTLILVLIEGSAGSPGVRCSSLQTRDYAPRSVGQYYFQHWVQIHISRNL